jgi:hypothetical protein
MARNNSQEAFKTLPSRLDHLVREPIRKHLAWQDRDVDSRRFSLKNVSESLKIGITSSNDRMTKLESGDIGLRGRNQESE